MIGDAPAEGGGGGGGGVVQLGVSFGAGVAGGLLSGGGGLHGAAIRGVLQSQQLLAQQQLRQALIANRLQAAQMQLSQFAPREHPILEVTPAVTPQTQKLAQALMTLRAAGKVKRATQVQQQLARVQAKNAPLATYQYVAQYGLNMGPPLAGSRDAGGF